jgi:uncharacterized membrane protein
MSNSTGSPDATARAATTDARVWRLRVALVVAYLVLAHVASTGTDGRWAAWALFDVALVVLLPWLARGRAGAWLALAASAALLWWLAGTAHAWTLLLAVPVVFVAFVGFGFARTLRTGSVPLVTRIAAALDGVAPQALDAEVRRYTRRVTIGWAVLLSALALFDLAMALLATRGHWSWFANIGDYVAIGGFMLAEFAWRRHRFPGRHRSFLEFMRRMLALGPAFWRSVATP